MSADTDNNRTTVLSQLRSTMATLGGLRQSHDEPSLATTERDITNDAAMDTDALLQPPPTASSDAADAASAGLIEAQSAPDGTEDRASDGKAPATPDFLPESGGAAALSGAMSPGSGATGGGNVLRKANKRARIMIVDDESLNVMVFRQHLIEAGYTRIITTCDSTQALSMVRTESPDVVLLDINMPNVSGLDILRVMGLDPSLQHIPVLVLTAATDPEIRTAALDLGASDFLNKPVDPSELLPRVRNAVILKQHFDVVAGEAARLEQQVERRTRQLEATRQALIVSLARAAEHRDTDTGNHVLRVGRYTAIIARELGYPEKRLSMLEQAAQLHDVGKIGIPDSVLFKPGRLDPDQFELMKKHCALGKQIIEPVSEKDFAVLRTHTRRGEALLHVRSSPLLMLAARIAQTHHEKWDGSGYPLSLSGTDIPLEGRIVAVADVFDALSSARPYKKPFSREKCFEIMESGRAKHFDPDVLDAFFARADEIVETQMLMMDEESPVTGEHNMPHDPDDSYPDQHA